MKVKIATYWEQMKASYWLVPGLMSIGAVVLFVIAYSLDRQFRLHRFDIWLLSNRPEAARDMLTTVAASLITVGGVAFSVTIGAVAYASMQFGPRLLTSFMKDRGNQLALGTFIATFLFSLLVLLTVRGREAEGGAFVPHLAITLDLVLVLSSLGVLIYFFHHVPESIHVFNLLADVGGQFNRMVCDLFPECIGDGSPVEHESPIDLPANFAAESRLIRIRTDGYIQAVDDEGLFELACENELVLEMIHQPGDFVNRDRVVVLASPAHRISDDLAATIAGAYVVGAQRTSYQDPLFLIKELIEIAARALSTGQNDPYTAITCINWLGSNLVALAGRQTPASGRFDEHQRLRVIAQPVTFDRLADTVFDGLRPYVKNDANVAVHLMDTIRWIAPQLRTHRQRQVLRGHAEALAVSCADQLEHDRNLTIFQDLYRSALTSLTREQDEFAEAEPPNISHAVRQQG